MDSQQLHLNIDFVGSSGIILSAEQKATLQNSLTILKNNMKFSKVYFWGKVLGVKNDYFIVQGIGKDELGEKKTLYSNDCISWGLLPVATDAVKQQAKLAKGRFTGDPSFEFEHVEVKKIGEGDDATEEEETVMPVQQGPVRQDIRVTKETVGSQAAMQEEEDLVGDEIKKGMMSTRPYVRS